MEQLMTPDGTICIWDSQKEQLEQLSVKADEPGFSKKKVVAEIDKMWQHLQNIL